MTRINLLDWRAERREQNKREFFAMLASGVAVGLLIGIGIIFSLKLQVEAQNKRNKLLLQEIADADEKIKEIVELEKTKESLEARIGVIESLQESRSATVHLFDQLVETLPDGVYLTAVTQTQRSVTIEGIAESNGRVSTFMSELDKSDWFEKPELVVIRAEEGRDMRRQSVFTLKVISKTSTENPSEGEG